MTHADTLIYHEPFAARFVQVGALTGLDQIGYESASYYPMNSELAHSLVMLPGRSDEIGIFVNLGWLALALLAAWCIGASAGHGWLSLLAACVVVSSPCLVGTQPGQGSNDIAAVALLASAVALLVVGEFATWPTVLAGLGLGLAISTKLTIIVPAATVMVLVTGHLLIVRRSLRLAVWWLAAVVATRSFWFLRDWVISGSPVPWFDIDVGPLNLPARVPGRVDPLVETATDANAWNDMYLPGLRQAFGVAWPAVVPVPVIASVVFLIVGPAVRRIAGAAVLAGVAGYLFTPYSGGLSFVFNIRYLTPVLLTGACLAPAMLPKARVARAVSVAALACVLLATALSANHERVEAWPWECLLPTVLILGGLTAMARELSRVEPRVKRAALVLSAIGLLVGGRIAQSHYVDRRYADAQLNVAERGDEIDALYRYFRLISSARVGVIGTTEVYPLFGIDLSNEVVLLGDDETYEGCRAWRTALSDGEFDYLAVTSFGVALFNRPDALDLTDDAAVHEVLHSRFTTVYRIGGALDPTSCTGT